MMLARRLLSAVASRLAEVGLWTPAEITTALWLDAADASTITLRGSNVSQWADKSGNSRHAIQPTAAFQPTRGTNVIMFDGSDDYFDFTGSENTGYALKFGTGSFSMLAILAPSAVNRNPQVAFGARGYGDGWFFGLANATLWMRMYSGSEQWSPSPQTSVSISTGLQMLGATAPRGATGAVYKNGVVVQSSSSVIGGASMANANSVRVGCYADLSNNPVGFWLGGMHEKIIFPGVATLADWQKAEGYLAHKWDALLGVTTLRDALPSGHPYKTAAPTV